MSEYYRQTAAQLIRDSIDPETGQLNMSELASRTNDWVREKVDADPDRGFMGDMGSVAIEQDRIRDKLTIATREVLGIIPRSQWTDRYANSPLLNSIVASIGDAIEGDREPDYDTGLIVNNPIRGNGRGDGDGMTLQEALDPSTSMRAEGVTATRRDR